MKTILLKLKKTSLLLMTTIFISTMLNAQKYYITFNGYGDTNIVKNVTVENLTQKTSLTLPGDKTLVLNVSEVGINEINAQAVQQLTIYPNPSNGTSLFQFGLPHEGNVEICLYDMAGKLHKQATFFLQEGIHTLTLPSMATGVYLLSVRSMEYNAFGKWISIAGEETVKENIKLTDYDPLTEKETTKTAKAAKEDEYTMNYTKNDLLRFTGQNGKYRTIVMKRPTESQQMDFRFIACKDGSGNYYPIVEIAGVYWMAEDFKSLKDAAGVDFFVATDTLTWKNNTSSHGAITSKDFGSYNNDYGYYYNYAAASDALPDKWRLPTKQEFEALYTAMGKENMEETALGLLLEKDSTTSLWKGLPASDSRNETGFGAKATGYISWRGVHMKKNEAVAYWTYMKEGRSIHTSYLTGGRVENTLSSPYEGFKIRGVYDPLVKFSKEYTLTFQAYGDADSITEISVLNLASSTDGNYSGKTLYASGNQTISLILEGETGSPYALEYTTGDLLYIQVKGAKHKTIMTRRIFQSQQIDVRFIDCPKEIEGNYPVVEIGEQYWMAEDLNCLKNDIPLVKSPEEWADSTSTFPLMTYKYDSSSNTNHYKADGPFALFYNYKAAVDMTPEGWRLPTKEDFDSLYTIMGRSNPADVAQGLIFHNNSDAMFNNIPVSNYRNETGFGAKGLGYIGTSGNHNSANIGVAYWTSTESGTNIYTPYITKDNVTITSSNKGIGCKVRYVLGSSLKTLNETFGGNLPTGTESEIKPVGESFVMEDNHKQLFIAVGQNSNNKRLNHVMRVDDITAANNSKATTSLPNVPDVNSSHKHWTYNKIKKATSQRNINGTENLVIAVLNNNLDDYGLDRYGDQEATTTLYIFGDSASNYNFSSVTLGGKLPVAKVKYLEEEEIGYFYHDPIFQQSTIHVAARANSIRLFYDIKTCDINGDFVEDFILVGRHKIAIYDGQTYSLIAWKDFAGDHPNLVADNAFYTRVAIGDVNQDGKDDIIVLTCAPKSNNIPKLRVYLDGNITNTSKEKIYTLPSNMIGKGVNITAGDVSGDRKKEIVMNVKSLNSDANNTKISIYALGMDANNNFSPSLQTLISDSVVSNRTFIDPINLVYFDGLAADPYIVSGNKVFQKFDTIWQELLYDNEQNALVKKKDGAYEYGILADEVTISDYSDDTREQLVYFVQRFNTYSNHEECIYAYRFGKDKDSANFARHERLRIYYNNDDWENGPRAYKFPVMATVRSKRAARILSYKRYESMLSNLQVNAVLAAAPYQLGCMEPGKTSFGKSTMSGIETTSEHTTRASAIFGFELEFSIPLIGVKAGGVDFTTKASYGYTRGYSHSQTIVKTTSHTIDSVDHVIVSCIPYDCYFYNIEKSNNPKEIGSELMMAFPGNTVQTVLTMDRYNEITKSDPKAPKLGSLFSHTSGNPFSYPKLKDTLTFSNISDRSKFCIVDKDFTHVNGMASGFTEKGIELIYNESDAFSHSADVDVELVISGATVKFGAGFGYGYTNKVTYTTGSGTKVAGSVMYPYTGTGFTPFSWSIVFYNYKLNGITFPVVNYITQ